MLGKIEGGRRRGMTKDEMIGYHHQLNGHELEQALGDGEEVTCNAGDLDSIPRLGRFPGEGMAYPLLYSCLENFIDRGA